MLYSGTKSTDFCENVMKKKKIYKTTTTTYKGTVFRKKNKIVVCGVPYESVGTVLG